MKLFIVSALVILGVSTAQAGVLAPKNTCPNQTVVPKTSKQMVKAKQAMLCLHNYARRSVGVKTLRYSKQLNNSGHLKTKDLIRCKEFSHTACGRDFGYWIKRTYLKGATGYTYGENLAWASGRGQTPRYIMTLWLNSDGHRKNILSKAFEDVGFGVIRRASYLGAGNAYIWTTHLGRK